MEELYPLESSWIVALAAGAIALVMLLALARSLPAQNIAMIAACLLAGEALLEFWRIKYTRIILEAPLWHYLAGGALLWLTVVLCARRLGKLILRPWRSGRHYGFWLLGMSAVGTALFQYGWPSLDPDSISQEKAAIMALVRGLSTVIFLACLTPWFIRKRPASRARRSELAQQPKNEAQ